MDHCSSKVWIIVAPLIGMLKKKGFKWTNKSRKVFEMLKTSLINPPVLKMSDFEQEFVVKCDASSSGLGAVLIQEKSNSLF